MNVHSALGYVHHGYRVFPVAVRDGSKRPLTRRGFLDATLDERQVIEWFRRWPQAGIRVRRRPQVIEDDGDPLKVLTRTELARLIEATDPRWRVLVELLAGTGLRINEALALRWSDVDLGSRPSVHVVRAIKGKTMKVGPPKSRAGRRRVPLPASVARDLRLRRAEAEWHRDDDLVFPNSQGALMDDGNLRRRIFAPATWGARWTSTPPTAAM